MYCLGRKSRQHNRDSAAGLTRGFEPEKEGVCNISNLLAFLLWVWVTIVVIGNGIVLTRIQKEMQLLGSGVTTKAALGSSTTIFPDEFHSYHLASFLPRLFDRFLAACCRRWLYPYHCCPFRSAPQNQGS
jgi:hypothetical protein